MKKAPVILAALSLLGLTSCNAMGGSGVATEQRASLDRLRTAIIENAPYKQWDARTGAKDLSIGRTPAGACEAIRFLAADAKNGDQPASRAAAEQLSGWVMELQQGTSGLTIAGGVPSTPDLPAPANQYYYAIDAIFCAEALLDMADLTDQPKYLASAELFGRFILSLMRDERGQVPSNPNRAGLCEAVLQQDAQSVAWNCRRYTKNLLALPTLMRLHALHPNLGYQAAATQIRTSLMDGLKGHWEYAEGPLRNQRWSRIKGPYGEPNHFIYGDTLAYALQGLYRYEGPSHDVRQQFQRLMNLQSISDETKKFDPSLALPGYILAEQQAADPFSAYYDVVTTGLLHPVSKALAPEAAQKSVQTLRKFVRNEPYLTWNLKFDFKMADARNSDISTLSATALMFLEADQPAPTAPSSATLQLR